MTEAEETESEKTEAGETEVGSSKLEQSSAFEVGVLCEIVLGIERASFRAPRYPGLFNLLLAILEFLLEYLRKVMATEMESERQRAALEINMLEIYTDAIRAHTIELCSSTYESSNL